MRVVLDTNTIVSALIHRDGPSGLALQQWREGAFQLIASGPLLLELADVLPRPRLRTFITWSNDEILELLAELRTQTIWVDPVDELAVVERDPDDNRVLEAAVAGSADMVVSGDRDLLDLGEHAGIPIVTAQRFLEIRGAM